MAKSDQDHARQLLDMARQDHTALGNMLEATSFPEAIFGFHAQQTIEKALKAWISALGKSYPKTHDLSALTAILRAADCDPGDAADFEQFAIFAVQYRYEPYDSADEALDRVSVMRNTATLLERVQAAIQAKR